MARLSGTHGVGPVCRERDISPSTYYWHQQRSTGDSCDNALAGGINGLYKAEVIHRKSWQNHAEVELATLAWVDWYNNRHLPEYIGHIPPVEAEKVCYVSIKNNNLPA